MTSMNTKAQDGPDLWKADACWVSTMSFNTVHINHTLVQGPCDSKFWSEVDGMFAGGGLQLVLMFVFIHSEYTQKTVERDDQSGVGLNWQGIVCTLDVGVFLVLNLDVYKSLNTFVHCDRNFIMNYL